MNRSQKKRYAQLEKDLGLENSHQSTNPAVREISERIRSVVEEGPNSPIKIAFFKRFRRTKKRKTFWGLFSSD